MASILKIGSGWRAQVRRKGHNPITETFPTKAMAQLWSRRIEAEIDGKKYQDGKSLSAIFLRDLIDRYVKEIGAIKKFGRNKTAVLAMLQRQLGDLSLAELNDDRLTKHVQDRMAGGAGGVTIAIELTYLSGLFKTAKQLWKINVSVDPIISTRANMRHLGITTKSVERERRPTDAELTLLCDHFDKASTLPMRDLIMFAVHTAMRLSEITGLRWADLNKSDKTVIIRDRKHPTQKVGNDQEVPLLGESYAIALRQPSGDRIFAHNSNTISTIFPRACHVLGIVDLHFHDLRHEGVTRLFEQGLSIQEVAIISGHRDWKMLARYTQLRAVDIHGKIAELARRLESK